MPTKPVRRAVKKTTKKSSARRPALKKLSVKKASSPRQTGLPAQLIKLAKPMLSRRSVLLTLLKEEGLTPQLTLRLAKALETVLRAKLPKSTSNTLADLIHEARDKKVIAEETFHLANRLRHQRNAIAHDSAKLATLPAHTLLAFSTSLLLFAELGA